MKQHALLIQPVNTVQDFNNFFASNSVKLTAPCLAYTLCHLCCVLQALQQDKEHLQRQLLRCTPGEFDRLHNELLVAKRSAAELAIVQEQLARHKQLWSEAEQRLAELQVRTVTPCVLCRCARARR
jgi:hypothetical protein